MTRFRMLSSLATVALLGCAEGTDPGDLPGPSMDAGVGLPDECTGSQPCSLMPGARQQAFLAAVGDEDPWVFDVPQGGRIIDLRISNDAMFSPIQIEAALFGPGDVAITNRRSTSGGRQQVEIQALAPSAGTHRLVVRDIGGDGFDRRNPYFVEIRLIEDTDANEANNEASSATPLTLGVPSEGLIAYQGDRDWYAVDVAAGGLLEVRMSAPGVGELQYRWSLFAPDGTTRIAESTEPSADQAWPIEVRAVGPRAGRYLILVEDVPDNGEQANPERVYTIEVRERVEQDPQEGTNRNDTRMNPSLVTAGAPVMAYIASTADVDWYAIDVPRASMGTPQIVSAEVAYTQSSAVDLQLSLFAPDGTTPICEARDGDLCRSERIIRDGVAMMGPTRLRTAHPVTSPGTYILSVRDLQDDEFEDTAPYTLTVDLPNDPDAFENFGGDARASAVPIQAATATTGTTIGFPWVEGYISYANDVDWYRFEIPGPMEASPGQNGDWLVRIEVQMPSPTPVELNAIFVGRDDRGRDLNLRRLGPRCRNNPGPNDREPCQYPDADNGLNIDVQTSVDGMGNECFVLFRERTVNGPHFWRISDLDRDDFDRSATGRYRFRMTVTAGCPTNSACMGRFLQSGQDLCGRP